jgi:hypothetical protein
MNNTDYIISSDELFDKIQQDASDNKIKIAAQLLLDAINDWPTLNVSEPKEFLLELTNEIGSPLTFGRIENYSKTLNTSKSSSASLRAGCHKSSIIVLKSGQQKYLFINLRHTY